jgi:hypothetical protein
MFVAHRHDNVLRDTISSTFLTRLVEFEASLDENDPRKPRDPPISEETKSLDNCEKYSKKRRWNKFVRAFKHHKKILSGDLLGRNPNIYLQDILDHPEIGWDSSFIASNPNITPKMIDDHPELSICCACYSRNPNLNWDYVVKNLDKPWIIENLAKNSSIDPQHFINLFYMIEPTTFSGIFNDTYFDNISKNELLRPHHIETNPEIQWCHIALVQNKGIPSEYLFKINKVPNLLVNLQHRMTMRDVLAHPEIKWNVTYLSTSEYITLEDILKNPQINWDTTKILLNPNITLRDLYEHPHLLPPTERKLYNYMKNPNFRWGDLPESFNFTNWVASCSYVIPFDVKRKNYKFQWSTIYSEEVEKLGRSIARERYRNTFDRADINDSENSDDDTDDGDIQPRDWVIPEFNDPTFPVPRMNPYGVYHHHSQECQHPHFRSDNFRSRKTREFCRENFSEILAKACHPRRSVFSWNEDVINVLPKSLYLEQCLYWNNWRAESHHEGFDVVVFEAAPQAHEES